MDHQTPKTVLVPKHRLFQVYVQVWIQNPGSGLKSKGHMLETNKGKQKGKKTTRTFCNMNLFT